MRSARNCHATHSFIVRPTIQIRRHNPSSTAVQEVGIAILGATYRASLQTVELDGTK